MKEKYVPAPAEEKNAEEMMGEAREKSSADREFALAQNDIIMFQDRDLKRMAVIREIESGQNGTTYKASQEARRGEIMEIRPEQVIAVYKIQL